MRRGFLAAFCKISGPRVAHALSWECGAALDPAGREGLRFSAFSVDDGAAGQVVRSR